MSIFKYLTISHLQKVLAALETRFKGIENNVSEIENDVDILQNSISQSDWDENDTTSSSYIQNRTHWIDDPVETEVFTFSNFDETKTYYEIEIGTPKWFKQVVDGMPYKVVYNGITYTGNLTYSAENTNYLAGNSSDDLTIGDPFTMRISDYWMDFDVKEGSMTSTSTISLSLDISEIHKLDNKYLNGSLIVSGTGINSEIFNWDGGYDSFEISISGDAGVTEYSFSSTYMPNFLWKYASSYEYLSINGYEDVGIDYIQSSDGLSGTLSVHKTLNAENALADYSVTISYPLQIANGEYSHVEGMRNKALGYCSHAEGNDTIASSIGSHVEGSGTIASQNFSHAEGSSTTASGINAHAEGYNTTASGINAHAEGYNTTASGNSSHAEGYQTQASGNYSHAEGCRNAILYLYLTGIANATIYTITSSGYSDVKYKAAFKLLEGATINNSTITAVTYTNNNPVSITVDKTLSASAVTDERFSVRFPNLASGIGSHTSGNSTQATGQYSFAEGVITKASGYTSHSEGLGTLASSDYQHVQGKYNKEDATGTYAHIIGNGSANDSRSNAYTLDWSGNGIYAGKLTVGAAPTSDMDVATKQYVDSAVSGTSGGSSTLVDLIDTNIASPSNGQVLTYDSATSKWENKNIPSNVFVVNISGTDPNYTSDKTYEEIEAAYNAGKRCICIMSSAIYNLSQIYTFSSAAFARFSTFLTISVSNDTGEKKAVMRSVLINASGTIQVNTMTGVNDSDVLSKYNTESYTPASDYNPATKKYVDDSIPENNIFITTITSGVSEGTIWYAADKPVSQIIAAHDSGKICFVKYTNFLYPMVQKTNSIAYFMSISSGADAIDGFSISNTVQRIQKNIPQQLRDLSNVSNVSPTDGQLLKYNATTSKWEGVTLSLAIDNGVIQLKEGSTVISSVTLPIYNGGVSS